MTIDIQSGIDSYLEFQRNKRGSGAPAHHWPSNLDDPCARKIYYYRKAWDKKPPIDNRLQGVFQTGTLLEEFLTPIIYDIGRRSSPPWRLTSRHTRISTLNNPLFTELGIEGEIDSIIEVEEAGRWVRKGIVDAKSMSPNIYPNINCYADLDRYFWTKKYKGQMHLYAKAFNLPMCYILAINKGNLFEMKLIEFPYDAGYCEVILDRVRLVNNALKTGTPPDGINDPDECNRCPFLSHCCPDITSGGNLEIIDNEELEGILIRLSELEPAAKEVKDLEKVRDALLVKGQDWACGKYLITWNKLTKNFQAQPAKPAFKRDEWRKRIICGE